MLQKQQIALALITALFLCSSGCQTAHAPTSTPPVTDTIIGNFPTQPSDSDSVTLPTTESAPTPIETLPVPMPTEPPTSTIETTTATETLPPETQPVVTEPPNSIPSPTIEQTHPTDPPQLTEATSSTSHQHHYSHTVITPTCTDSGYTMYICTCGESYTDDYTPAAGHHYAEDSIPATMWSQGYTTYTCTVCKDHYQGNYVSISESEQAAFIQAVQDATLRYINQFRKIPAQSLDVLTQVANYRAIQLQENFAHSTTDLRAALAHFQYGKYITPDGWDPSQYYYSIPGCEAISRSSVIGTADEIGKHLAQNFYNSSAHWSYVGSSSYPYIAVGIAYDASKIYLWTCCVFVVETSEYE